MTKNKMSALGLLVILLSSNISSFPVLAETVSVTSPTTVEEVNDESTTVSTQESVPELSETTTETAVSNDLQTNLPASTDTTETVLDPNREITNEESSISTDVKDEVTEASITKNSSDVSQTESTTLPSSSSETNETLPSSSQEAKSDKVETFSTPSNGTNSEQVVASSETPIETQPQQSIQPIVGQFNSLYAVSNNYEDTVLDDNNILTYTTYVEHWSGKDAYSHNLLSHRYGITAEQLDGFLKSTGIAYDSQRINGTKLLEWEKKSGLDVRAIVAIAMAESSLGTQGIATYRGANMFGYAAFDLSPETALNFNDDRAIRKLTTETIIKNKNLTFQVQDKKAQKAALGLLNFAIDGGVYFTDTSGTGQRRAQIMENLDRWIDEHGGTPEIPEELRQLNTVSLTNIPEGFDVDIAANTTLYSATSYAWGECTWYVYNRAKELGYSFDPYMGNGGDWRLKAGYETTHEPKVGFAVSFAPGQAGADGTYGHVAIVEQVREDGSILISESNAIGRGVVSYRTFTAAQASQLTYVIGQK